MERIVSLVCDIPTLLREVAAFNFKLDGSGAEMAFPPSGGLPWMGPATKAVVDEIASLRGGQRPLNLMVNRLKPGVAVPVHRDWIRPTGRQQTRPTVERWHLAIQTCEGATFWHEGGQVEHFELETWVGPVPYWLQHSVCNMGLAERIHIVVDLDTPVPIGQYEEDRR